MQVFISHHSADRWVANKIAEDIQSCGAETFLDCRDVEHGDDFEERIVEAAHRSDELVVLFTPRAIERPYIWMEIGGFRMLRKRVVLVLYGVDAKYIATEERIPIFLKRAIAVDLNDIGEYLGRLRERCRSGIDEQ